MNRTGLAACCFLLATLSSAAAADIEPGLYLRTSYAFGNLSLNTVYFGKNNKIAIDPKQGVDPFDFEAAAKATPGTVGTFTIVKNRIVIVWSSGKTSRFEIEFEKGKLSAYDGGLVSKADAFPKEAKLAATFAGQWQTKNVSAARTLTFTADGKYTMNSLGGIRGIPGNTGIAEKTVHGKYKLSGNTLVLTESTGKVSKHTVLPFSTTLNPKKAKITDEHFILDGANLKREK